MSPYPRPDGRVSIIRSLGLVLFGLFLWFALTHRFALPGLFFQQDLQAAQKALQDHNVAKARALFDKALSQQPANPTLYQLIESICDEEAQWNLSIDYGHRGVQQCRDAAPADRAGIYRQLAIAYGEIEKTPKQEDALDAAQRAVELDPNDPEGQNSLGYLLVDNDRDLATARKLITQSLKTVKQQSDKPEMQALIPAVEDSYGWLLYKERNYPAAVDTLTEAMHDLPDEAPGEVLKSYYYHLGAANAAAGRLEPARQALQTALHYDPGFAAAKALLETLPPVEAAARASTPTAKPPMPDSSGSSASPDTAAPPPPSHSTSQATPATPSPSSPFAKAHP